MPRNIQNSPNRSPGKVYAEVSVPQNSRQLLASRVADFPITPVRAQKPKTKPNLQSNISRISLSPSGQILAFAIVLLFALGMYRLIPSTDGSSSHFSQFHNQLISLQRDVASVSKKVDALSLDNDNYQGVSRELKEELKSVTSMLDGQLQSINEIIADVKESSEQSGSVALQQATESLEALEQKFEAKIKSLAASSWSVGDKVDQSAEEKLNQIYKAFFLDNTATVDWARASVGAQIETAFTSPGLNSDWGSQFRSWASHYVPRYQSKARPISKPVDIVIGGPMASSKGFAQTDRLQPGFCFALAGQRGNITIALPTLVSVQEVHIDHITPELVPSTSSAPRSLKIFIDDCRSNKVCALPGSAHQAPAMSVGSFSFEYPKITSQSFRLDVATGGFPTRRVRFEILDNLGNENYTCVYRLRVHGSKA